VSHTFLEELTDQPRVHERRRYPRIFLTVAVTLEVEGYIVRAAESKDISLGGMFVVTNVNIPVGAIGIITVTKRCDDRHISFSAGFEVVRQERNSPPGPGIGIRFTKLHRDDRINLQFLFDYQLGLGMRARLRIDESKIDGIIFKIADNRDELEQAYRLVHDAYVEEKFMDPHSSGMRLSLHHSMPFTATAIGLRDNDVVMATTVFLDSKIGLPIDSIFRVELSHLRKNNRLLAEIGALAIKKGEKNNNPNTVLHLQKLLFIYSHRHLNIDDLVIAINPKHRAYYKYILLAEQIGEEKNYYSVKGKPAIAMQINHNDAKMRFRGEYKGVEREKNLYTFFYETKSECIHFPRHHAPVVVWNDALLDYFFRQKTDIFKNADPKTVEYILNQYHKV
jgi:hypothetical protein